MLGKPTRPSRRLSPVTRASSSKTAGAGSSATSPGSPCQRESNEKTADRGIVACLEPPVNGTFSGNSVSSIAHTVVNS